MTVERSILLSPAAAPSPPKPGSETAAPLLIDVKAVAALLGISSRTVYRLSDGGKMPRPIKLGALVRWKRADVENWIAKMGS